ncbi:MAG: RsmE family RNA methyltransferase [Chloroflexota bacterium]
MHRFYVRLEDGRAHFQPDQLHQLRNVLRLREGDRLAVFDGSGREWVARLAGDHAELETEVQGQVEPRIRLVLYQSLVRAPRLELVLQKGTELGVSAFVPFVSQRTVASGDHLGRWEAIVKEAAEQAGRRVTPAVCRPVSCEEAIRRAGGQEAALMPWEEAQGQRLADAYTGADDVGLIVGPEGGFTAGEVELARRAGVATVTLGPRVLRSETAAIVAAALLLHLAGDL